MSIKFGLFTRGKYTGRPVAAVAHQDPAYIVWCYENAPGNFGISNSVYAAAKRLLNLRKDGGEFGIVVKGPRHPDYLAAMAKAKELEEKIALGAAAARGPEGRSSGIPCGEVHLGQLLKLPAIGDSSVRFTPMHFNCRSMAAPVIEHAGIVERAYSFLGDDEDKEDEEPGLIEGLLADYDEPNIDDED